MHICVQNSINTLVYSAVMYSNKYFQNLFLFCSSHEPSLRLFVCFQVTYLIFQTLSKRFFVGNASSQKRTVVPLCYLL